MRDFSLSHEWLSINTATLRKQNGIERSLIDILDDCARHEVRAVSPWRDQVAAAGLAQTARVVRDHGLQLSGYCRGGMFTYTDAQGHVLAREENQRALAEAVELGATCLVLVVGGLPGALDGQPASKDIALARNQVRDGIGELLEQARDANMPLAIEPLHPMYAADRACVNTMAQTLDLCDELDPARSGALGVAVDMYHVWWDHTLQAQITRAGRERLLAFHVCDWLTPTTDLLLDRGMMGDGVINLRQARGWMEEAGFAGFSEVEIFSRNWWQRDGQETLRTCIERHRSCV